MFMVHAVCTLLIASTGCPLHADALEMQRHISLIINYFQISDANAITVLTCWTQRDKNAMLKQASEHGLKVSFSFESMEPWPDLRRGGVLDLNCPSTHHYLTEITNEKMLGMHSEWLFIDVIDETNITTEYLGPQTIVETAGIKMATTSYALPGSCVRIVQVLVNRGMTNYFNMYRITMRETMMFRLDFSAHIDRLPTSMTSCSDYNRTDFRGATITAAVVIEFPKLFSGFDSMYHMDVDIWPKTHYPITILFAEQLNFKINFTVVPSFGWLINNTYFDGMIGMLQREEAEIGATGAFMRSDRMNAAQFCAETFDPRTAVIFKQPPLSSAYNIFLMPFSQLVWIACIILSALVAVLLVLEWFVSRYRASRVYEQNHVRTEDLITLVLSTVCQQGTELSPVSIPARITIFIFSLTAFFLYTSYSANIVALLQSKAPVLKSLQDITNSRLGLKVQDLRYNRNFFREATDPNIIELYKKKVEPFGSDAYCLPEEGIRHVRSGKNAFSVEANVGYKIISDTFEEIEKCGLGEMKMFFNPKLSIPVVKRSGHREHITRMMAWQREVGLLGRIGLYWLPHKPSCEGNIADFMSVGISDSLPAILVFLYGIAITFIVFLLELAYYSSSKLMYKKKKNFKMKSTFKN